MAASRPPTRTWPRRRQTTCGGRSDWQQTWEPTFPRSGFLEAQIRTDDDVDRCADAFATLCPAAAERGVTLCFEGLFPADGIQTLAARAASPAFGCYFDLANPLRRGLDPPTEIRALGPLVRRVHIKDMLVRPG